jgi:hypothetical protein
VFFFGGKMSDNKVEMDVQKFSHDLEVADLNAEQQEVEGVAKLVSDRPLKERDMMNRMLGQIEMSRTFADFANVISVSKLAEIKENKLYQSLEGVDARDRKGNLIANVSTWDGFCRAIGMSSKKADEDIRNLNAFGEEALERMNHLGVGYRNMRKLRQIPDDDRLAIIQGEAIEVGDKEEIISLIEDMATKHAAERKALQDQLERSKSEHAANQRLLADKDQKINELDRELKRELTPDELMLKESELNKKQEEDLTGAMLQCLSMLDEFSQVVGAVLSREKRPEHLEHALFGNLRSVMSRALVIGCDFGIHPEQVLDVPIDIEALEQGEH